MKKLTFILLIGLISSYSMWLFAQYQNGIFSESLHPHEAHRTIKVAVKIIPCYTDKITHQGGAKLMAYNPNEKNDYFFAAEVFRVEWFQDGRPIGTTYKIDRCICGSPVEVIITDLRTYRSFRGIGIVPLCDLITPLDNES